MDPCVSTPHLRRDPLSTGGIRSIHAQPAALRQLLEGHLGYTHPPEAKADLEALLAQLRVD